MAKERLPPPDEGNLKHIEKDLAPWLEAWGTGKVGCNGVQTAAEWLVRLVAEVRMLRVRIKSLERQLEGLKAKGKE